MTEVDGGLGIGTPGALMENKVMLVSGAGPGMGSATARVAAREGASVALVARSRDRIEGYAREIRDAGGSAIALECDLGDEDQIARTVDRTHEEFGRLDAVFYNARYVPPDGRADSDLDIDLELWDASMAINVRGPLVMARRSIPLMTEHGGGSFVLNSSSVSLYAEHVRPAYSVSKAALNALMRFIAVRHGRDGIRANAIFPFSIGGPLSEIVARFTAIGRSGTPREIAEVVVFLSSERAALITGQLIHLDGGLFAGMPTVADMREQQVTEASGMTDVGQTRT